MASESFLFSVCWNIKYRRFPFFQWLEPLSIFKILTNEIWHFIKIFFHEKTSQHKVGSLNVSIHTKAVGVYIR